MMMDKFYSILYIGDDTKMSNSSHRIQALKRLGHNVIVYNPSEGIQNELNSRIFSKIHYYTGYAYLQKKILKKLANFISLMKQSVDVIWVNSGELLGPNCMKELKKLKVSMVLYNNDDPTGGRDGARFKSLLKSIPYYDVCAVLRKENVVEYINIGAKKVVRVNMSYDEIMHQPFESSIDISQTLQSEVAFIGTWMRHEKRDEFLLKLIEKGLPISIWGSHWSKSPYFEKLKPYYRGGAIYQREYVAAIQGAKICLGFLSKGNRDLHTRRSVEVPFIGSLFCAERTSEHQEMYTEGEEAVFWSSEEECATLCLDLLQNIEKRESIRLAGMERVRQLQVGNEDIAQQILEAVFSENN